MLNIILGITMTLMAYFISIKIYGKTKHALLNPVLVSSAMIIAVLLSLGIQYQSYQKGGDFIAYFLGYVVVALAIPMYKNRIALQRNMLPIFGGTFISILVSCISVIALSKIFGLDKEIIATLIPKSITSPMALETSRLLNSNGGLTVVIVIITGICGAMLAPFIIKASRVKNNIARGIGIGACSHGVGTSKAMEIDEEIGAASSLAMGLAGVLTVLTVSVIVSIVSALK